MKLGLLPKIVIAIVLGIVCGLFFPDWATRIALTFNAVFGNFLTFIIPLLIFGLVAPGIADLGQQAGRLLLITAALAYAFTLFSGFGTFFLSKAILPGILRDSTLSATDSLTDSLTPYFSVDMPPVMGVVSALILAFVVGLGTAYIHSDNLKNVLDDFKSIIDLVITKIIIPLLPIYIFGIFLSMTQSGQVVSILSVFIKLFAVVFAMTIVLLLIQFSIAGIAAKRNPLRMLGIMMTAYVTALGTQSSAATIPVTLERAIKLGVRPEIAGFVIPLCATIHLSGSMMKIVACTIAIAFITGYEIPDLTFVEFILMMSITVVAAPGVPGGVIMAALGILQSILGFNDTQIALMIATYIAMDSFGTATNVTGDGAVAVIVERIDEIGKR